MALNNYYKHTPPSSSFSFPNSCDTTGSTLMQQKFHRATQQEQKEQQVQFACYNNSQQQQEGPSNIKLESSDADHSTAATAATTAEAGVPPVPTVPTVVASAPYYINKIHSNDDLSLFTVESILGGDNDEEQLHQQQQHQHQHHHHGSYNDQECQCHDQGSTTITSASSSDAEGEGSKLATEEECHLKTIHDLKQEIYHLRSKLNEFMSGNHKAASSHSSSDTTDSATTAIAAAGAGTGTGAPRTKHEMRGRWTDEEHELFLEGYNLYGRRWKKVAGIIKTRTMVQTRTHAQKYFKRMAKLADAKRKKNVKKVAPVHHHQQRHSISSTSSIDLSRDQNLTTSALITPDNSVGRSLQMHHHHHPVLHHSSAVVVTPTTSAMEDGHNIQQQQASPREPMFRTTIPQLPSIEVCRPRQQEEEHHHTLILPNTAPKAEFQSSDWNQSNIEEDFAETLDLLETICSS